MKIGHHFSSLPVRRRRAGKRFQPPQAQPDAPIAHVCRPFSLLAQFSCCVVSWSSASSTTHILLVQLSHTQTHMVRTVVVGRGFNWGNITTEKVMKLKGRLIVEQSSVSNGSLSTFHICFVSLFEIFTKNNNNNNIQLRVFALFTVSAVAMTTMTSATVPKDS